MTWTQATSGDVCKVQSTPLSSQPRPALVLITCILASSLAFVDGSVVNVGLPAIGRSLHADAADLQWVINAYLLPLSALLLTGGALGDRLGRRNVLICGILLFGCGSALCTAAPSLGWLLAARAFQGFGAALLLPNSLAILGAAFTGEARGRAVGTWSAASSIAAAIGPVLGGWLIDEFGWREIFVINIPLACAGITMSVLYVPNPVRTQNETPLDSIGAVLATASLAAITWGLTIGTGPSGWSDQSVVSIVVGIGFLIAFLWNEGKLGDRAMMPLALFETKNFIGLTLLTLLLYGALGAFLVLVPYLLIQGAGWPGTAAGAALLPFPIVLAVTSRAMGGVAGRLGSRIPLTVGSMIVGIGFLLLLRAGPQTSYWNGIFPAIIVMSVGMAGAVAPLTTAVLASVDAQHTGSASGLNSAVARTGGLIATALLGSVLGLTGLQLFVSFHQSMLICAMACFAAGAAAFVLLSSA
jgi:EmrB/QacA subfamily drug resistance transporter